MGFLGTKHIALLFDDKGEYVDEKSFKRTDELISYGSGKNQRKFNIILDECSTFDRNGLWRNKRYYFYNINNPNPILHDKKSEPVINSRIYNTIFETKVARDLNNLADSGLMQFLTFRNVVIALIVLGVIVYFSTGGTLTGKPVPVP